LTAIRPCQTIIAQAFNDGPLAACTTKPPISLPRPPRKRAASAVPRALRRYLSLDDFEAMARRRLPKFLYGYISGGAETDASVRDNRRAFEEYGFVPRVLKDVSGREQTTTLFGKTYTAPFGIPPMGSAALCAYRGDIVLTRAAAAMNVPMILSASSLITLEDVKRENPAAWYQAYLAGEPSRIEPMVDRVAWDTITHPHWLFGTWARTLMNHGMPHFENMDAKRGPPVLSKNFDAQHRPLRPARLEACRADPPPLEGQACREGPDLAGGCAHRAGKRRRWRDRLQSCRSPA
jgi:L-lactate dehydrogenase (cytochrome)